MDEGGLLEGNQKDKAREKHKHTPTQVVVSMLALARTVKLLSMPLTGIQKNLYLYRRICRFVSAVFDITAEECHY